MNKTADYRVMIIIVSCSSEALNPEKIIWLTEMKNTGLNFLKLNIYCSFFFKLAFE